MLWLIVLLVVLAAVAGILWELLELALWIAFIIFLAGGILAVLGFVWARSRLTNRSAPGR